MSTGLELSELLVTHVKEIKAMLMLVELWWWLSPHSITMVAFVNCCMSQGGWRIINDGGGLWFVG